MKRQLVFVLGFFSIVPLIILFLILFSLYLVHEHSDAARRMNLQLFQSNVVYSALPEVNVQTLARFEIEDARVAVLKEFFDKYNSPLLLYAEKIVREADVNDIDYRLLPAIAMQESNVCKKAPDDSYNCWGFGIYGGKVTRFSGYNEAIEVVSRGISKHYVQKGMVAPSEIMTKYTPGSNGSWAFSVDYFMDQIHSSL